MKKRWKGEGGNGKEKEGERKEVHGEEGEEGNGADERVRRIMEGGE